MEAKFFRFLKLVGVGFKARSESQGRELFLKLGYSHEVQFTAPPAVRVFCFKPNIICGFNIKKKGQGAPVRRRCSELQTSRSIQGEGNRNRVFYVYAIKFFFNYTQAIKKIDRTRVPSF